MKSNFSQVVAMAPGTQAISITEANRSAFRKGTKGNEIRAISIATRNSDVAWLYLIILILPINNFTRVVPC